LKKLLITFALLAAFATQAHAVAVGDTWYDPFIVLNADGTAGRQNTDLSLFTATVKKDLAQAAYTSITPAFRNRSTTTGVHDMLVVPTETGYYEIFVQYSGTDYWTFYETVTARDVDDVLPTNVFNGYTDDITSGGSGGATEAQVKDIVFNNNTGLSRKFINLSGVVTRKSALTTLNVDCVGRVGAESPAVSGQEFHVFKGNAFTRAIIVTDSDGSSAFDLTGYSARFAVKDDITSATFSVASRDVTADIAADPTTGIINLEILAADTSSLDTGVYWAEIQISTDGTSWFTAWQADFYVDPSVYVP